MTHNLHYGDQVTHLLNSNAIWAEYRDQKHDLFITDSNVRGYLTGKYLRCEYIIYLTKMPFFQETQRQAT